MLGAPLEQAGHDNGLVYKYRLKGEQRESEFFRLSVWFDDSGEIPLRMESQHSRYHTKADFMERKVFFKVSI